MRHIFATYFDNTMIIPYTMINRNMDIWYRQIPRPEWFCSSELHKLLLFLYGNSTFGLYQENKLCSWISCNITGLIQRTQHFRDHIMKINPKAGIHIHSDLSEERFSEINSKWPIAGRWSLFPFLLCMHLSISPTHTHSCFRLYYAKSVHPSHSDS